MCVVPRTFWRQETDRPGDPSCALRTPASAMSAEVWGQYIRYYCLCLETDRGAEGTSFSVRRHSKARGRQREIEGTLKISSPSRQGILDIVLAMDLYIQVRGASCADRSCRVWKSRWPSWAFRPNEPYGFCGRKAATLNHALRHWSQFVPKYVNPTSEDTKLYS